MHPTMVTIKDVAAKYGIHPKTVRGWISRGLLESHRPGRSHLIKAADVDTFVSNLPGYRPRRKAPPD
jgi:excisionase family DNA binding protein